jgi:hypothetical protein
MQQMQVTPAPHGTHEDLMRIATSTPSSLFVFPPRRESPWLGARRGHRAIGVVYDPRRDPIGNWVPTVMGRRYDAFLSFDDTEALHPLHLEPAVSTFELETYPWAT